MASTFKQLSPNDKISTKTLLHEAIPITGTIVSGTYGDVNIKNFSHGMFQSVYDYPYLSSSANHIFDITVGFANNSALSASTTTAVAQRSKKINLYNQMSQVLVGYDKTGSIQQFDEDGNLSGGTKLEECMFFSFSRLLVKDEIKKGSFQLELGINSAFSYKTNMNKTIKITDASGSDGFKVNSPVGEYGILYATASLGNAAATPIMDTTKLAGHGPGGVPVGLIFYQAGVVVVSGSVFNRASHGGILHNSNTDSSMMLANSGEDGFQFITGSSISSSANAIRNRIYNIQFNNTVELNSSIYFCRINHNEYNYSANPTYLNSSQIRVKAQASDKPVSYITTVGLYSADNQLLAVGKLSEPLRKDPTIEYTLRARLDY